MPLRDKDGGRGKPAADLLRRTLASPAGAPGSDIGACPDSEIFAAYAERSLDAEETARYELHFSQCARCREQLAAMAHAAEFAGAAGEKLPRSSGAAWLWDWRWVAPAAAALVFVAIVVTFRPLRHPAGQSSQPLVAMNQPTAPSAAPPANAIVTHESGPAAPAREPNAPAVAASRMRSAPDLTTMAHSMKQEPDTSLPAKNKKLHQPPVTTMLGGLGGSRFTRLDGSPVPPAPAEHREARSALASPRPDSSTQNPDAANMRAATQTVTVESAVAPATASSSKADVPHARGYASGNAIGTGAANGVGIPAPSPSTSESVTVASATPTASLPAAPPPPEMKTVQVNGAVSASDTVTKESTSAQQLSMVVANRNLTANESVMVQANDATSAQTLVHSPDPQVLWRFSAGRFVERSSDAGATWHVQWTNANAHLVAGVAPSSDSCWLVGRAGLVLVTANGKKWKQVAPPADTDFVNVAATDASSATLTSADGRKFTTSDRGNHWSPAP